MENCNVCGGGGAARTKYGGVCRICERAIERELSEDMEALESIEEVINIQQKLIRFREIGVICVMPTIIHIEYGVFVKWFGLHGDVISEKNDMGDVKLEKTYAGRKFIAWKINQNKEEAE